MFLLVVQNFRETEMLRKQNRICFPGSGLPPFPKIDMFYMLARDRRQESIISYLWRLSLEDFLPPFLFHLFSLGGKRFLKTFPEHLSGSCYFIAHKWSPAMVTKVTNVPTFARSLPLSMVNPPLWILSTELHRFILTGIHIFSMERENKKGKVNMDIHTSYLSREPRVYSCKFFWPV